MKRKIQFTIGVIILLAAIASCHSKKHHKAEENYTVTTPLKKDTVTQKEYVAQIRAIQHIELRALENGYLQNIYVDEGQYVKKGQLMFQLLPIQYKAELNKAKAEANYTKIEYENTKMLADSNVVAPTQLALAKAKYEKAKADVALAQTRMTFAEVRAPFSGLMDRFHVRLGSLLEDGELLTTMSDISTLWVYFNVPEAEYLEYQKTIEENHEPLKVKLKLANHEIYQHIGKVETIEADFNNETGNIAFRATFPNSGNLLRHGQTGSVILNIDHKDALLIPQKATFEVLDQKYVYVVDENDVIHARRISVDAEMRDIYIVKEGLSEKDKILLEGLRKVRDNDKIAYTTLEPKMILANLELPAE